MTEEQKPIYYRPAQVAEMLNVSVRVLGNMRRQGKIQGEDFGNITLYTEDQIKKANLARYTPGPKAGSKRGRKQSDTEGASENKSLDYTDRTGSDNRDNLGNRWRTSRKEATIPDIRQLVGA